MKGGGGVENIQYDLLVCILWFGFCACGLRSAVVCGLLRFVMFFVRGYCMSIALRC